MTLAEASGTISFTCPQCAWTGTFDRRYPVWCEQCQHGLNALSPEELQKREREKPRHRRRRENARRRAEELEAGLATAANLRPGGGVRLAAVAAALVVHLMGLTVLATGIWLLTLGHIPAYVAGVFCLGVAWVVRPRIPRMNKKLPWKRREDLPHFFGLLDKAAAAMGAPAPRAVTFSATSYGQAHFNASTNRLGLRRTPVLNIGVPLWQVLSRPERQALLGHELGHLVNGDVTGSLFVWSAQHSLSNWRYLFTPSSRRRSVSPRLWFSEFLAALAMLPLYFSARLLERLFAWIHVGVTLRAEYLADEKAAKMAGTDAAISLIRALSLGRTVVFYLNREKTRRGRGTPSRDRGRPEEGAAVWADLDAYLAVFPEHEHERLARVSEVQGTSADSDHPADYLRLRLLKDRPRHAAALTVDDAEWEAVEKELYPLVAAAGIQVLR